MVLQQVKFFIAFFAIAELRSTMAIDGETWPREPMQWSLNRPEVEIEEPSKITLEDLISKSNDFPLDFPDNSTRCSHLVNVVERKNLERITNAAYPLIHEQALRLFVDFLYQKRRFGNKIERDLYQNMSVFELIDRLLTKRAVSFFGVDDEYLLLDKSTGKGGWENVGTETESPPLILSNCLSYDEIKLSALLSVSSPSYFVNSQGQIQGEGIITGAVGARLEKEKVMEYREVMKTKEQNTHRYGYGQFFIPTMQGIFINFYGDVSLTYEELKTRNAFQDENRYLKIEDDKYFDKWIYNRRMSLSIDSILLEANDRAKKQKKKANLFIAALGLHQWRITSEQDQFFLDTCLKRIEFLGKSLHNLQTVYFPPIGACFPVKKIPIIGHPNEGITIEIRDWAINDLRVSSEGELNVVSYNWDGNALPGNKYWLHKFEMNDPAKLTQIAEIQNPHINIRIQASNIRVVTLNGLVSIKDYLEKLINK